MIRYIEGRIVYLDILGGHTPFIPHFGDFLGRALFYDYIVSRSGV